MVLEGNAEYAVNFIRTYFEGVDAASPQGTYMIFLDCTEYCRISGKSIDELIRCGWNVGVGWQDGRAFGGSCHIRMNLASPMSRIREAFERLRKYVFV